MAASRLLCPERSQWFCFGETSQSVGRFCRRRGEPQKSDPGSESTTNIDRQPSPSPPPPQKCAAATVSRSPPDGYPRFPFLPRRYATYIHFPLVSCSSLPFGLALRPPPPPRIPIVYSAASVRALTQTTTHAAPASPTPPPFTATITHSPLPASPARIRPASTPTRSPTSPAAPAIG